MSEYESIRSVLADRYDDDPFFKATVDAVSRGGFADDDGVFHPGPTVGDCIRADKIIKAQEAAPKQCSRCTELEYEVESLRADERSRWRSTADSELKEGHRD